MIMGHEKAIETFTAQTHANPNKEIMSFATERLPTLREHLAIAQSLQTPEGHGGHGQLPTTNARPDPQLRTDPTAPSTPLVASAGQDADRPQLAVEPDTTVGPVQPVP